ncbi:hypothetical protein SEA_HOLLOW_90 [Gordonia phage Hollow]|nr:hypothetical protein SEA_HOLLOW_90 [Gordonia phage Hollow]
MSSTGPYPGMGKGSQILKASERTSIWRQTFEMLAAGLSGVERNGLYATVNATDASISVTWMVESTLRYATVTGHLSHTYWSGQVQHIATEMFEKALRIMHNEEAP